jgi:predicted esterase
VPEQSPVSRNLRIPVALDATCLVREASGKASQAVILLHGYLETGKRMLRQLEAYLPEDALVLAPNGLFPLPTRTPKGLRLAHGWYLYNPETDEYVVDMRAATEFLRSLIAELVPPGLPISLVAFSQGGYLSPFVARAEPRITRVIGIGCQFLNDELEDPLGRLELHGVHGENDQVVDPSVAARDHRKLLDRGARGTFTLVPGSAHAIDAAIGARVAGILGSKPQA